MSFIIEFLTEMVFEVGVKGLGYIILRRLFQVGRNNKLDPDGFLVVMTGLAAWAIIIITFIVVWKQLSRPS